MHHIKLYRSGRQIALGRRLKNITSGKLSQELGITSAVLSTFETGAQLPGHKLIQRIVPACFEILHPYVTENKFWRALHYERHIASLLRPGPFHEYTVASINNAIYNGLREYPFFSDYKLTEPEDAILLKNMAFLYFLNVINISDIIHDSNISQYLYVTPETIKNLTTTQKIDFLLALYKMIGYDYETDNTLPTMVFVPWQDPKKTYTVSTV